MRILIRYPFFSPSFRFDMTMMTMKMVQWLILYLKGVCLFQSGWRPNFLKNWSPHRWKISIPITAKKKPSLLLAKAETFLGTFF